MILGGVASQDAAFDTMAEILPGIGFHTMSMALGAFFLSLGKKSPGPLPRVSTKS